MNGVERTFCAISITTSGFAGLGRAIECLCDSFALAATTSLTVGHSMKTVEDEAYVELLCFLVVGQLIAFSL
ncbi:MAG TPA: hypothetical protein VJU59_31320 [Paraburkholderia sp.]|uniref:hypothetical protein n=1 Tax=Paraburkholderia sp. TaxID=1926495 RepID=UPI002B46D2A1|nr:hypothetical protein [Paraburkholderia sp.]HKR44115.1 hypothetical protein [Paraburkholderia sp.]